MKIFILSKNIGFAFRKILDGKIYLILSQKIFILPKNTFFAFWKMIYSIKMIFTHSFVFASSFFIKSLYFKVISLQNPYKFRRNFVSI